MAEVAGPRSWAPPGSQPLMSPTPTYTRSSIPTPWFVQSIICFIDAHPRLGRAEGYTRGESDSVHA